MASSASDFERFLYANYPDDYRRATAPDVADDVLTAILARHNSHYKVWKDIPEWIKNEYGDRLPSEVLNGNVTPRQFVNKELDKASGKEETSANLMDFGLIDFTVTLLAAGYAQENAIARAKNRATRKQIMADANGQELTDEQKAKWFETRLSDTKIVKNDWKYNQTEKYLLHIAKEMSREYKRAQREGREPSKDIIAGLTEKLNHYATGLETTEDKRKLVDYLRQEPQQAALKHLEASVLDLFGDKLKEQGIVITPPKRGKSKTHVMDVESLSQSLEDDFSKMQKMKNIMRNKHNYQNSRSGVRDVLNSNDGVGRLFAMQNENSRRRA